MNDTRINGVEKIGGTLAASERQLREELLNRLVLPNLVYLRGGNSTQFGQNGWYSAQSTAEPIGGDMRSAQFAVPNECSTWFDEETDGRDGLVFRFFAKRAWIYLTPPVRCCRLEFTVPFTIVPEALSDLHVWIGDIRVPLIRNEADRYGRARFVAEVLPQVLTYMQMTERVRVDFSCSITGVPALLYAGSADQRRLSCAISRPRFVEV
jgi:hypothetical protein